MHAVDTQYAGCALRIEWLSGLFRSTQGVEVLGGRNETIIMSRKVLALAGAIILAGASSALAMTPDGVANTRTIYDNYGYVVKGFDVVMQGYPMPTCSISHNDLYFLAIDDAGLSIFVPEVFATGKINVTAGGHTLEGEAEKLPHGSIFILPSVGDWGPFTSAVNPTNTLTLRDSRNTWSLPLSDSGPATFLAWNAFAAWKKCATAHRGR
jgi:hypothetical protein